jgi:hypothetical protein
MTGEAHWIDPLLMLVGALGIVLMVWRGSSGTLLRRRQRDGICPHTRRPAQRTVAQDTLSKEWVEVERCSVCVPADRVACDKACLAGLNH